MKSFKFWRCWLIILSSIIILFGLFLVLFSNTKLFTPFNILINGSFPVNEGLNVPNRLLIWLYAILGATMIGWGIFILYLLQNAFALKERWTWYAISVGMLAWFIPDTFMSYFCGAYFNVILNSFLFLAFLMPLIFTFKVFNRK
jgi:hypothetical protein